MAKMTTAERIAEKLLAKVITVGMLRQTMEAENVDMRTAVNMWKANLTRYATTHIEDVEHWLKQCDASRTSLLSHISTESLSSAVRYLLAFTA